MILVLLLGLSAWGETQQLRMHPHDILKIVGCHKRVQLRPGIAEPAIHFESETSLKDFQDAVEPQWGLRPDAISNVYVVNKNEIYLSDNADYYRRTNRYIDDSLAHELVHFIQVKHQGFDDLSGDDLEADAIEVQTWFRENIISKPNTDDPCFRGPPMA